MRSFTLSRTNLLRSNLEPEFMDTVYGVMDIIHTWLSTGETHFSFMRVTLPSLLAAHQYRLFEIDWAQSAKIEQGLFCSSFEFIEFIHPRPILKENL